MDFKFHIFRSLPECRAMHIGFSKGVPSLVLCILVLSITSYAQGQVLGEEQFVGSGSSANEHSNFSIAPVLRTQSPVVEQLVEMNSRRAQALLSYQATRRYSLSYQGFWGTRRAEMVVKLTYRAPGTKEFTILSESGSKWIIDRIFKGLLQSEKEGAIPDNAGRMALDPTNYEFTFVGQDSRSGGHVYVFSIKPRSNYKYLYRGQICVDANDFAVVEMRGQPARNPSPWMRNTAMEITYTKVGDFWLPSRNHSVSQVRLGGNADLTIEYINYKIIEAALLGRE
jgi:hypothetical protein